MTIRHRFLRRCVHCGVDPQRVLDASRILRKAASYLERPGSKVIAPSAEYERGAQHALDWALGLAQDDFFERHLRALEKIGDRLAVPTAQGG